MLKYISNEREGKSLVHSGKTQRGFITNYLTSLTTEQIISNTLTGFLINLIRKKGNMMQFSLITAYVQDRFDTLRKPNGKPYNHPKGNFRRSIMCSLTSNGVFQKVRPEQLANSEKNKDDNKAKNEKSQQSVTTGNNTTS